MDNLRNQLLCIIKNIKDHEITNLSIIPDILEQLQANKFSSKSYDFDIKTLFTYLIEKYPQFCTKACVVSTPEGNIKICKILLMLIDHTKSNRELLNDFKNNTKLDDIISIEMCVLPEFKNFYIRNISRIIVNGGGQELTYYFYRV